ncbi:hypothetical protein KIN20_006865 [Parelaphostrongylus tenuis]|uniref:Uncharacterized protein n=1 Tax=Parelaphostrongylus tenuis TaxID=148309 RepID=A0AAD5MUM1_PARTN|nr:hypothetical protein KIN20_006865 [Parelaphostrongylus tenuis]
MSIMAKAQDKRVKRLEHGRKKVENVLLQENSYSLPGQKEEGKKAFEGTPDDLFDNWCSLIEGAFHG